MAPAAAREPPQLENALGPAHAADLATPVDLAAARAGATPNACHAAVLTTKTGWLSGHGRGNTRIFRPRPAEHHAAGRWGRGQCFVAGGVLDSDWS